MDIWFAEGIQPLLFLCKPLYFIPVTTVAKSENGALLVAHNGQKEVARIPLAAIYELVDSKHQMQVECQTVSVIFSKKPGAYQ